MPRISCCCSHRQTFKFFLLVLSQKSPSNLIRTNIFIALKTLRLIQSLPRNFFFSMSYSTGFHKRGGVHKQSSCISNHRSHIILIFQKFSSSTILCSFHPILTFGWLTPPSVRHRKTLLLLLSQPETDQGHQWLLTVAFSHLFIDTCWRNARL